MLATSDTSLNQKTPRIYAHLDVCGRSQKHIHVNIPPTPSHIDREFNSPFQKLECNCVDEADGLQDIHLNIFIKVRLATELLELNLSDHDSF